MRSQRSLAYATLLVLSLCSCSTNSGLYIRQQSSITERFDAALKPLAPEIWTQLNASGEDGVLFIFTNLTAQMPMVSFVFAGSPEVALNRFVGSLPKDAMCVYRYRDALPFPPTTRLCVDYQRINELAVNVQDNDAEIASLRGDVANALGSLRKTADETLQTIKSDVASHSRR